MSDEKKYKTKKSAAQSVKESKTKKKSVIKLAEENNEIFKNSSKLKSKIYLDFKARFLINIIIVVILIGCLVASIIMSFSITKSEKIVYSNKSSIDYKVYLNDNEFYNQEYLNKGMAYVASLIDKINIDYNFQFKINKESNINLTYKVMAKIVIASQNNSKIFYENEYEITKEEIEELTDIKEYTINKNVIIDYDYYNDLANKFKSKYAVNTLNYLDVYLEVNEENREYELNNKSTTLLTIPLSQQEINIGLEEKTIDEQKQIMSSSKVIFNDNKYIILDVILFVLSVAMLTQLLKRISIISVKKSKYDKYINKLLRGYDRLIVNVRTAPIFSNYNIIKVESFEELLDVRDNIKEPIQYFNIVEHQKCEFFIINQNDLYLYVVKSVDIDNK